MALNQAFLYDDYVYLLVDDTTITNVANYYTVQASNGIGVEVSVNETNFDKRASSHVYSCLIGSVTSSEKARLRVKLK
jgi:hypothetical protein